MRIPFNCKGSQECILEPESENVDSPDVPLLDSSRYNTPHAIVKASMIHLRLGLRESFSATKLIAFKNALKHENVLFFICIGFRIVCSTKLCGFF